jgi:hypothetical protein
MGKTNSGLREANLRSRSSPFSGRGNPTLNGSVADADISLAVAVDTGNVALAAQVSQLSGFDGGAPVMASVSQSNVAPMVTGAVRLVIPADALLTDVPPRELRWRRWQAAISSRSITGVTVTVYYEWQARPDRRSFQDDPSIVGLKIDVGDGSQPIVLGHFTTI